MRTTSVCKVLAVVLVFAAGAAGAAGAQEKFPTKPIRMLVPFSAGSATDFLARLHRPENDGKLGPARWWSTTGRAPAA